MSSRPPTAGKLSVIELAEMKRRSDRIVMVTTYDYPSGRLADAAGVDLVLVGDSGAMVVMGYEATVPATMEEMLLLTRWVARGAQRPLVVGDMPFGSYQVSDEAAVENAIRMVKEGGADLVKLEGAGSSLSRTRAISEAGITVMGHIGLTPQSATKLGGHRAQGRSAEKARRLYDDALALEDAGVSALVLEAVPAPVAAAVTEAVSVPTIGIGAGPETDGQVLVWHDLLGLYEGRSPRFVKRYGDIGREIQKALEHYIADVRSGTFPEDKHTYGIPEDELARFQDTVRAASTPAGGTRLGKTRLRARF
jgi:3-methyl-2-oxobutanoate hydroxymethyltransferase